MRIALAAALLVLTSAPVWAKSPTHHAAQPLPFLLGSDGLASRVACPLPNPNLLGPGNFIDGCALPAAGLNLAAPLASPHFTGTPLVNGAPLSSGPPGPSGPPASPGGPPLSLQYNNNGVLGGYVIGKSFGFVNDGQVIDLASQAACFNLGPWSGDLTGAACAPPVLSSGAAARNLGSAGGAVKGSWSNLTLNQPDVFSALGTPAGDLGGTTYATPLVTGLYGFPIASTPPQPQSALVWNGTNYSPQNISPGINQLSGDVLAGPGTGLQTTTIQPQAITNTKLALMAPMTVKANPGVSQVGAPQDIPVSGGLSFVNGSLQLAAIGTSQQYTVAAGDCLTVNNGFITGIAVGIACTTGGDTLTADDGSTALQADDGATGLIVDGLSGNTGTSCLALQTDFSVTTGCNMTMLVLMR